MDCDHPIDDEKSTLVTGEYLRHHDKFKQRYGKIALLMQVGSFYECYSNADETRGNAREIAKILNMRLKQKKNGTFMMGFPCPVINNHLHLLYDKDLVVVVMDQFDNGGKVQEHRVVNILSKGTDLNSTSLTNNVISLYYKDHGKNNRSFGFAMVDITRSKDVTVHEIESHPNDRGCSLDTAIEVITQFSPVECIFISDKKNTSIVRDLGLDPLTVIYKTPHAFLKEGERDSASIALNGLKEYLHERFYDTDDLNVYEYSFDDHIDMTSTAIQQLDIPILIETLDFTLSPMGKRLLKDRLVRPMICMTDIQNSLDAIDNMTTERSKVIRKNLQGMVDLEKLHQKMALKKLNGPQQLVAVYDAYNKLLDLCADYASVRDHLIDITTYIKETIDVDVCDEQFTWDTPLFVNEHQDMYTEKCTLLQKIEDYIKELEGALPKNGKVYLEESNGGFKTTAIKAKVIKEKFKDRFEFINFKSGTIVTNTDIQETIGRLKEVRGEISNTVQKLFHEFCKNFYDKYKDALVKVVKYVANLDFIQSAYTAAQTFRYTKPTLHPEPQKFRAKELRHAIIEQLHPDTKYIPNDVDLCADGTVGYILLGANASGKTSLLKSVGIAVVMAHAGMYVPATELTISIFTRIMTRISGGDNILRGQSSFVVECEEIRSIAARSDSTTLVLGDEMCRGTEVESATAIVYTLIQMLMRKKSLFLSATHLFSLAEHLGEFSPTVKMFNTKTTIEDDGTVVYRRTLEEGPGRKLYGLEIARALAFPPEFIRIAMGFRDKVNPLLSATVKKSRYNSKKILVDCQVCGHRPQGSRDLPLDTHHINFQCNATDGYHGIHHKDALHNLITLCKGCHIKVHQNELVLEVVQTPKGSQVKYHSNTANVTHSV